MPEPHLQSPEADVRPVTPPLLLRIDEAAETLRISRPTLERLVRRGEVVPVHIGKSIRFRRETLEAFVIGREQQEAVDFS